MGAEPAVVDGLDEKAVVQAVRSAEPEAAIHEMTALSGRVDEDPRLLQRESQTAAGLRASLQELARGLCHLERRAVGSHTATMRARTETQEVQMAEFPAPKEGIVLTHFIVSDDIERSRRFYTDVLGGETVREGEPSFVALANGWIIINLGGGPTDDKPTVTLETPPDPDRVSSFLNVRVADIQAVYTEWSARGAEFLTPPQDRGAEIRCYVRDPDGHLIEVGQSTGAPQDQSS